MSPRNFCVPMRRTALSVFGPTRRSAGVSARPKRSTSACQRRPILTPRPPPAPRRNFRPPGSFSKSAPTPFSFLCALRPQPDHKAKFSRKSGGSSLETAAFLSKSPCSMFENSLKCHSASFTPFRRSEFLAWLYTKPADSSRKPTENLLQIADFPFSTH